MKKSIHVQKPAFYVIISPLNTVPKKDSLERRVILDLSAAGGTAVNVFISKDEYLGEPITLTYPRVDDLVNQAYPTKQASPISIGICL
jgi:hypothetical protein